MDKYLSTGMVARICQVSPMTIAKWVDEGSLPGHTTPGGHRRVAVSDLVHFLKRLGMHVPESLRQDSRARVLAVHRDSDDLGRVAEAILAASDRYEFRGTTRGVDALVLVGEWKPRIILLDLALPDVDSLQICQRLSELAGERDTEIIALAPDSDEPAAHVALDAGAVLCVSGDSLPERILDVLASVLSLDHEAERASNLRITETGIRPLTRHIGQRQKRG